MSSMLKKTVVLMMCSYSITGCQLFSKTTFNQPKFQPNLQYMRIVINNKKESWVVSSFTDNWPKKNSTVWYSKDSGVIRFNNGRLISYSTVRPLYNWVEKIDIHIDWKKIASGNSQIIQRCVTNTINTDISFCSKNILKRTKEKPNNNYIGAENIIWIKESSQGKTDGWKEVWYGLKGTDTQPTYGSLCLNEENCLSWQQWQ